MTTATTDLPPRFDIPEYARNDPDRQEFLDASTHTVAVHLNPATVATAAVNTAGTAAPGLLAPTMTADHLELTIRAHIGRLVPTCGLDEEPQYLESVVSGQWEGDGDWDEWNPIDYRPLFLSSTCPVRLSVGHYLDDQTLHISFDPTFADPAGSTEDRDYVLGADVDDEVHSPDASYVVFQVRATSEGDAVETVRQILAMAVHAATTRPDATTVVPKTLAGPANGADDEEFVIELSRSWRTVRALKTNDYDAQDWVRAFADQFERLADDRFTAAEERANALGDVGEWTTASSDATYDFRGNVDLQYRNAFANIAWDDVPVSADAPTDAFRVQVVINAPSLDTAVTRALNLVIYVDKCATLVLAHANGYRAA